MSACRILLLGLAFILPFSTTFAVAKRRVLVMDIKNVDKNPNYNYLEPSITDAIIEDLQKEFVFDNFDKSDWKALAKSNFILAESHHTKSSAMQLGLLGRQDMVIGGYFKIVGEKIVTHVHIVGMKDKKVLKEFSTDGYADSRIFDSIRKISKRVATETKDLLPNDEEWTQTVIQGNNQFGLEVGFAPLVFPGALSSDLPNGSSNIYPNDFGMSFLAGLDYQYIGLLLKKAIVWGNFTYSFTNTYETGKKASETFLQNMKIKFDKELGHWNYQAFPMRAK